MSQLSLIPDSQTRAVNVRIEDCDVYAGRPRRLRRPGRWDRIDPREVPEGEYGWLGNPYDVREQADAIEAFRSYFEQRVVDDEPFRESVIALKGKRLGCFCKPSKCHADIIAAWVEANS